MPTFRIEDFEEEEEKKEKEAPVEKKEEEKEEEKEKLEEREEEKEEEEETEEKPSKEKVDLSTVILDSDDLPEELRGKSAAEIIRAFNNTRAFAQGLYARTTGGEKKEEPKEEVPKNEPLFTEDELGVGADPRRVEDKVTELVNKRVEPFVLSALQRQSEDNLRNIIKDDAKYPHAKRLAKDILTMASQLNLEVTANPATWETLYHQAVGKNYAVLEKERTTANPGVKPKPGLSSKGDNHTVGAKGGKRAVLSPEQKDVCLAMGISEEDFIKNAKRMGIELNGKL